MNAPRQEAKETPPEFVDTVLEPPRTRVAQTPAPPSPATLRAVAPAEMARAEGTSPVVKSVPARSGFFGRRTWIVVLLLLLLLVLGFVALVVFVD